MKEFTDLDQAIRERKEANLKLIRTEMIVISFGLAFIIFAIGVCTMINVELWKEILIASIGILGFILSILFAIRIEQKAGEYKCARCGETHKASFKEVLFAMHFGTTRYLKCPHCRKKSWNKKIF